MGAYLACYGRDDYFSQKNTASHRFPLFDMSLVPPLPIGIMSVRITNFINSELFGKPTDLPWGFIFPHWRA